MRTRILGSVAAVAFLVVGLSFGDDPPPKYKGTLPANWKKIGLDDDQKQTIYKIQSQYRGKIDSLEQQIRKLKDDERGEMEKVLTKAQKERLKEIREKGSGGDSGKKDDPDAKDSAPKDKIEKGKTTKDKN